MWCAFLAWQYDNICSRRITRFSSGTELKKMQSNGNGKKSKNGLIPVTLQPSAPEMLLKLISYKCKKRYRGACRCRKAGLKCSIICTNCNSAYDNIEVRLQDSDEEKERETVLEQLYDKIEAEADYIENILIVDYMEKIPICEISLGPHDEKLAEPRLSGTAKRMRMH